jgi:hypothetical protein
LLENQTTAKGSEGSVTNRIFCPKQMKLALLSQQPEAKGKSDAPSLSPWQIMCGAAMCFDTLQRKLAQVDEGVIFVGVLADSARFEERRSIQLWITTHLATTFPRAEERLLTGVHPHVLFTSTRLCEPTSAPLPVAHVGFLASVNPYVPSQIIGPVELCVASCVWAKVLPHPIAASTNHRRRGYRRHGRRRRRRNCVCDRDWLYYCRRARRRRLRPWRRWRRLIGHGNLS